jgi:hypothetical protein
MYGTERAGVVTSIGTFLYVQKNGQLNWEIFQLGVRTALLFCAVGLSRSSDYGRLGKLRASCNIQFGESGPEILGKLSKALELLGFDGFLSFVFDFGNLQCSLDDLFLCVSSIEQHLRSLLHRNYKFPSAHTS